MEEMLHLQNQNKELVAKLISPETHKQLSQPKNKSIEGKDQFCFI
jgi:hypothetical protein